MNPLIKVKKLPITLGLIFGVIQSAIISWFCWEVYVGATDSGLASGLYLNMFGYLPWGWLGIISHDFVIPIQINYQVNELMSYLPVVIAVFINWFILGFLIGSAIEFAKCQKDQR